MLNLRALPTETVIPMSVSRYETELLTTKSDVQAEREAALEADLIAEIEAGLIAAAEAELAEGEELTDEQLEAISAQAETQFAGLTAEQTGAISTDIDTEFAALVEEFETELTAQLTRPYTSARLNTQYNADFTYGRFEMRAKMPSGQGAFPAFWMMPTDNVYGEWPLSGEIDIVEHVNLKAGFASAVSGVTAPDGTPNEGVFEVDERTYKLFNGAVYLLGAEYVVTFDRPEAPDPLVDDNGEPILLNGQPVYVFDGDGNPVVDANGVPAYYPDGYQVQQNGNTFEFTSANGNWYYLQVDGESAVAQTLDGARVIPVVEVPESAEPGGGFIIGDDHYEIWSDGTVYRMHEQHEDANIYGTLHYGRPWPDNSRSGQAYRFPDGANPADDFHTYAVEWNEGEIRWYADDYLYATQRMSETFLTGSGDIQGGLLLHRGWYTMLYDMVNGNFGPNWSTAPFDQDFHLILNNAVGGNWPDNVGERGVDPAAFVSGQSMIVDYVRVYQCPANPETGIGCETVRAGHNDYPSNHVVDIDEGFQQARYALVEGAAPIPELPPTPPAGELVVNGGFDDGLDNWGGAGLLVSEGDNNYITTVVSVAGNPWDVGVQQVMTLTPATEYEVSFRARSSVARNIAVGLGFNYDPWTNNQTSVALTTEWQTFTYTLTTEANGTPFGGDDNRVFFELGAEVGDVDLDDISVALPGAGGDVELLVNRSFDEGDDNWAGGGAVETEGDNSFYLAPVAEAGNPWDVNLEQVITLTPATEYVITFDARASNARNINVGLGFAYDPWTNSQLPQALTTEWQTYTVTLTTEDDDGVPFGGENNRVFFEFGAEAGDVSIDNISVVIPGEGSPNLLTNSDFSAGLDDSWILTGDGSVTTDDGNDILAVDVETAGNPWDVNLAQVLTLTPAADYTVTFRARADVARSMNVGLGFNYDPWTNSQLPQALTTEWQTYTVELNTSVNGTPFGGEDNRVFFELGAEIGAVYLDDIVLTAN